MYHQSLPYFHCMQMITSADPSFLPVSTRKSFESHIFHVLISFLRQSHPHSFKVARHSSFTMRQSETNGRSNRSHHSQLNFQEPRRPSAPFSARCPKPARRVRGVWLEFEPVLAAVESPQLRSCRPPSRDDDVQRQQSSYRRYQPVLKQRRKVIA